MKFILKIVEAPCWRCDGIARLAFYDDNMPVSRFNDKLLSLARERGVIIKNVYSKTVEESYDACICPHCDAMFGDHFLPDYWYDKPIDSIEVEIEDDLDTSPSNQK